MPMITRRANDKLDVLCYANAVERVGGTVVSVTVESQEKYQTALDPHNTYRIWAMAPEKSFDAIDDGYSKDRFPEEN